MHYLVTHAGKFYRETEKPTELADGSLKLKRGLAFPKDTWTMREMKGESRSFGRGATPSRPGRPERINRAGGFGPDNTQR